MAAISNELAKVRKELAANRKRQAQLVKMAEKKESAIASLKKQV